MSSLTLQAFVARIAKKTSMTVQEIYARTAVLAWMALIHTVVPARQTLPENCAKKMWMSAR